MKHWERWRKYGKPTLPTPLERLEKYIEKTDDCWLWTGAKQKGYGAVQYRGRLHRAHRAVYTELVGEIPDGLVLDHLCRVPACVRPEHLEPVTQRENLRRGVNVGLRKGHPARIEGDAA